MVRLQSGELVCEIAPQLGGCIAGLWPITSTLLQFSSTRSSRRSSAAGLAR